MCLAVTVPPVTLALAHALPRMGRSSIAHAASTLPSRVLPSDSLSFNNHVNNPGGLGWKLSGHDVRLLSSVSIGWRELAEKSHGERAVSVLPGPPENSRSFVLIQVYTAVLGLIQEDAHKSVLWSDPKLRLCRHGHRSHVTSRGQRTSWQTSEHSACLGSDTVWTSVSPQNPC